MGIRATRCFNFCDFSNNNGECALLFSFFFINMENNAFDVIRAKRGGKVVTVKGLAVEILTFEYYENPYDRPHNPHIIAIITNTHGYSFIQRYETSGKAYVAHAPHLDLRMA